MNTPSVKEQEVWQNNLPGLVAVLKTDRRGEVVHELVQGYGKFSLSPDERLLNQDRAAEKELDMFSNGTLTPIRLVEDSEGAAELATNPNLLSEESMAGLLKLTAKQLEERLGEISNGTTLHRLLATAEEQDAKVSQIKAIKARINDVDPQRYVERVSSPVSAGGERKPRAVTPK